MKKHVIIGVFVSALAVVGIIRCGSSGSSSAPPAVYKNFLVVANDSTTSGNVHSHPLDSTTGAVGSSNTPLSLATGPWNISTHPSGLFAYASVAGSGAGTGLHVFRLGKTDGAMTELSTSPYLSGTQITGARATADGKYLYATDGGSPGHVYSFSVNAADGTLTQVGSAIATGGNAANTVVTDLQNRFVFAPNQLTSTIAAFKIDTASGALSSVSGSPFASGGNNPYGVAVSRDGKYLYSSNSGSSTVTSFNIDPTTGVLTSFGSPVTGVAGGLFLTASPTQDFLYIVQNSPPNLYVFKINTDGSLTQANGSPISLPGSNPATGIQFDPTGSRLYLSRYNGSGHSQVHAFTVDTTTGMPTDITGSPFDICLSIISIDVARILQ